MSGLSCEEWVSAHCAEASEIAKPTAHTRAWFARLDEREAFIKAYPQALRDTWVKVESEIAGADLHSSIVPIRRRVECADGTLLVYEKVPGLNLGGMEARGRFQKLPLRERLDAVLSVAEALAVICDAGYMVVDWYEGNMLYDFDGRKIWLFDWELCREGGAFVLEMDSNYGSSRLMAPEEFVRGSVLDEVTLVYNVGRYALLSLPELADPLAPLLAKATYPSRVGRYTSVREFASALAEETKS